MSFQWTIGSRQCWKSQEQHDITPTNAVGSIGDNPELQHPHGPMVYNVKFLAQMQDMSHLLSDRLESPIGLLLATFVFLLRAVHLLQAWLLTIQRLARYCPAHATGPSPGQCRTVRRTCQPRDKQGAGYPRASRNPALKTQQEEGKQAEGRKSLAAYVIMFCLTPN